MQRKREKSEMRTKVITMRGCVYQRTPLLLPASGQWDLDQAKELLLKFP